MLNLRSHPIAEPDRGHVMAYWVSGNHEWRSFFRWKQKGKELTCALYILPVVILTALLLYQLPALDGFSAVAGGLCAGTVVALFRCRLIAPFIKVVLLKTNDIIITRHGVAMNGKFSYFNNDTAKLLQIKILDEPTPKVLQINYQHTTPKGTIARQLYIPIPKGRLGEAVKLMSLLEE